MINPPLSLYIHLPWCVRKCPYCDFNSHAWRGGALPEDAYVRALLADLRADAPLARGRALQSIFIGGGTPSLFSSAALGALLEGVARILPLVKAAEITLEANPGTVEARHFSAFRAVGINRLSLGIQSFDDRALGALGRIHDAAAARAAIDAAQHADFNLNLDLMFGLPGQDMRAALADLETACAYAPQHLSWYQLTLEAHTPFAHTPPPALPDEDALGDMQEAGQALLDARGFKQYEVSAYAQTGMECRHNRNYWLFGDYLGIGAGAHGKISGTDGIWRTFKTPHPDAYLRAPERRDSRLSRNQIVPEFMLNALRLHAGFSADLFSRHTGLALTEIKPLLAQARARGWLEDNPAWIRPSVLGRRFLNDLLELFIVT
jgi:putative oxygen-independent coproporphyrinogen III oxidase